jgi:hypothetical protein
MPCSEHGSLVPFESKPVKDWSNLHPYTPLGGVFSPRKRADVVAMMQKIERNGIGKAKAIGSVYSLSAAPDSDGSVIDTKFLDRHLSQPFGSWHLLSVLHSSRFPEGPSPCEQIAIELHQLKTGTFQKFDPAQKRKIEVTGTPQEIAAKQKELDECLKKAVKPEWIYNSQWLGTIARPGFFESGGILIHVQAGIRIKTLLEDLAILGLALPTMGAGGGQTLAGAISTATHGSDFNLRPLGDAVRAVHLIGPGGQEWWIESNGGPGTGLTYSQLPDWCHDTRVVRDTDFLESVVVGVGRFGVIYSMVLEVVPQYMLEEERYETTWSEIKLSLGAGVQSGYDSQGSPFTSGRSPCAQIAIDLHQLKTGTFKKFDPAQRRKIEVTGTPQEIAAKQKELDECLKRQATGGPPPEPLRFWQLVIDPASGSRAWITHRRRTTDPTETGTDKKQDLFDFLCTHDEAAAVAALTATSLLSEAVAAMGTEIVGSEGSIPIVGPIVGNIDAAPYFELAADLDAAVLHFSKLGIFLSKVWDLLRNAKDAVGHGMIDDTLRDIAGGILAAAHDPPLRRGSSEKILDTHDYDLDGCLSVNSMEFFFDAASSSYIQFVDDVLHKAKELGPIMGIVSLRFVRETSSKLGMQRFPLTVCIEVAISRPGSVNNEYKKAVQELARHHGGIPHWGQEHSLNKSQVEQLYKDRLEPWRWALAETEISIEGEKTFSSQFTRERGLEVEEDLDTHRARRYVAAIISGSS